MVVLCFCWSQASQFNMEHFSGMHNWYACSHARPTFCNVCREALPGVTSHGLSCEGKQTHSFSFSSFINNMLFSVPFTLVRMFIQFREQTKTVCLELNWWLLNRNIAFSILLHSSDVYKMVFNVVFSLCVCVCVKVCKFKAHKRCAVRSTNNCKWTTLASIGNDIIEDEDGVSEPNLL